MNYLNLASGAAHFKSPPAAIKETILALENNETFYGETEGLLALRQAIADRYAADSNVKVPVENILITAGTKQALFNLFSVLLKPGDEVILTEPSWFGFTELFKLLEIKPIFLRKVPEENYDLKPEKLKAAITPKTRLFIFSNPGNPTGKLYSRSAIEGWIEVLANYPEIKILSDEIYDLIVFDEAKMPTLLEFPDPQQKHIVVNGFSKNFGMSGWRIGYLVAPPEILKKCVHFQHTTISGVNPFIQEGAVATLKTKNDFLPERIKELTRNREILCNWLTNQPGFDFFQPQAAYYVFADLRKLMASDYCQKNNLHTSQKFCEYVKEKYLLEFQPGEKFQASGFIRITFAVAEQDLKEGLGRLESFLQKAALPAG